MTLFTRAVARDFRMLFARCVAGRPRGPAPPVVIQIRDDTRTLAATTAEGVTLTHTAPAPKEPDDLLVLPASILADVEGGTDEGVDLDRELKLRGVRVVKVRDDQNQIVDLRSRSVPPRRVAGSLWPRRMKRAGVAASGVERREQGWMP